MPTCENCGHEVDEGVKFCKNCGSQIVMDEEKKEFKFCANCGFKMDKDIKFCPECGTSTEGVPQVRNNVNSLSSEKNSALAAILSFLIVGLGQVYLGLTKKGLILFAAAVVSGILMMVLIGWITFLIVWGYAIYDAYNSAGKMNRGIVVEDTIDIDNLF